MAYDETHARKQGQWKETNARGPARSELAASSSIFLSLSSALRIKSSSTPLALGLGLRSRSGLHLEDQVILDAPDNDHIGPNASEHEHFGPRTGEGYLGPRALGSLLSLVPPASPRLPA